MESVTFTISFPKKEDLSVLLRYKSSITAAEALTTFITECHICIFGYYSESPNCLIDRMLAAVDYEDKKIEALRKQRLLKNIATLLVASTRGRVITPPNEKVYNYFYRILLVVHEFNLKFKQVQGYMHISSLSK